MSRHLIFDILFFNVNPKIMVIIGHSSGKMHKVNILRHLLCAPIIKVPLTPQGINALTATPASASVLVKYFYLISANQMNF